MKAKETRAHDRSPEPVLSREITVLQTKQRALCERRERQFRRLDVNLERLHDLDRYENVQEYLERVELEIVHADSRQPIRGRIAQFCGKTFVHASLPPMDVIWRREHGVEEMALMILARKGTVGISGTTHVISRGERAHFVLPSRDQVSVVVPEFGTEIVYMLIPQKVFDDIVLPRQRNYGDVSFAPLAPTFSFTTSMCAMSRKDVHDPEPLRSAAREIVRSTLRMVFGAKGDEERSRFREAMEIILSEHSTRGLSIGDVASQIGVSARMLQLEFKEHDTKFSTELRHVRAASALRAREEYPDMTLSQLAERAGFGSVASLQRALRSVQVEMTATE